MWQEHIVDWLHGEDFLTWQRIYSNGYIAMEIWIHGNGYIHFLNYYGMYFSYFKIIQSVFIFTGDKKMLLLNTKRLNHHNSSLIYYPPNLTPCEPTILISVKQPLVQPRRWWPCFWTPRSDGRGWSLIWPERSEPSCTPLIQTFPQFQKL